MAILLADTGSYLATAFFSFVAGCIFIGWMVSRSNNQEPPRLAGAKVPLLGEFLDLDKYYDIQHSGDWGARVVEVVKEVKIVGYVGSDDDEGSKSYMRGRWLVLMHRDGRKVYLMPHSILSLTESESESG